MLFTKEDAVALLISVVAMMHLQSVTVAAMLATVVALMCDICLDLLPMIGLEIDPGIPSVLRQNPPSACFLLPI